uniref:ORF76c n=1 Tax=Pinus koraiensis TaxID=88728 RepID=A4QMD5_PINKO|nr:ORF76c [Pinus koraiensis]ABP35472.1 ORF76c [Pinus koraiensis]
MDKFFIIKKKKILSELHFFFSSQKKELDSFFHFHGSYNNSDSFRPFRFKKNWSDSSHIDETERTDWFNFGHILKLH